MWLQLVLTALVAAAAAGGAVLGFGIDLGREREAREALGGRMASLGGQLVETQSTLAGLTSTIGVYQERVDALQEHERDCQEQHRDASGRIIRLEADTHRHRGGGAMRPRPAEGG